MRIARMHGGGPEAADGDGGEYGAVHHVHVAAPVECVAVPATVLLLPEQNGAAAARLTGMSGRQLT
jgi:hypothetical protein